MAYFVPSMTRGLVMDGYTHFCETFFKRNYIFQSAGTRIKFLFMSEILRQGSICTHSSYTSPHRLVVTGVMNRCDQSIKQERENDEKHITRDVDAALGNRCHRLWNQISHDQQQQEKRTKNTCTCNHKYDNALYLFLSQTYQNLKKSNWENSGKSRMSQTEGANSNYVPISA